MSSRVTGKLPSMLTKQVIVDGLRYILLGHFYIKNAHLPSTEHHVSENFMGVCVASNADPNTDNYIIKQVKELGLKRVRIDIEQSNQHALRFLDKLLAHHFQVTVHLVQTFEHAQLMHLPETQSAWKDFVSQIAEQYAGKISAIEIGNTINRKRWAGYHWAGFMQTWRIAHAILHHHGITLIGPNIQDFEPLYNISVLKQLKQMKCLPDLHSNNLFVERVIEPERFDFRILKYRWAQYLHYNLIKKARLLHKIGQDFGVKHMVSSVAFWAMYRIERQLPNSAQKQADYAARYFTLLAASGTLVYANWGALICQREGLINDGLDDEQYPKLERVAYYQQADGVLADYRPYPSFNAVKTAAYWLQGSQYLGYIASAQQLEVHHFTNHGQHIHIAWTTNANCAVLAELYHTESLAKANILLRDGKPHHQPLLVTESPIYLIWQQASDIAMLSTSLKVSATRIHAHVGGLHYFPIVDKDWRGMILAKSTLDAQHIYQQLHPNKLLAPISESQALRNARNVIWSQAHPIDKALQVTIKKPVKMYPHKQFFDRFKPSKAQRSWNGAMELMRRGVPTAAPLAFFEHQHDSSLKQNFYICAFVSADFTIAQAFSAFAQGQTTFNGCNAQLIYMQFATFCRHMHQSGIYFRDFSGGNILVKRIASDQLHFTLIDTARLHAYAHATPLKYRLADLVRALNKLHWAGREEFLRRYFALTNTRLSWQLKLPFYIYDIKVWLKRTVGRRAVKRLLRHFMP